MNTRFFKRVTAPVLLGIALFAVLLFAAFGDGDSEARANGGDRGIARAIEAQEANTPSLLDIPGVVGTGVGLDDAGDAVVVVFTDIPGVGGIPASVSGVGTSVRVSGMFAALPKGGNGNGGGGGGGKNKNSAPTVTIDSAVVTGTSVDLTGTTTDAEDASPPDISWSSDIDGFLGSSASGATLNATGLTDNSVHVITATATDSGGKSDTDSVSITVGTPPTPTPGPLDRTAKHRPAPNGVSIGHPDITAGTLGAIVNDGTTTYVLSNNHVLADSNAGTVGDAAIQPGAYDGGTVTNDTIGSLAAYVEMLFDGTDNTVDAALASVNAIDVTNSTPGAESYGSPTNSVTAASVGMSVQKYGRTTGHTVGTVTAINVTTQVCYGTIRGRTCHGGLADFTGQISISDASFSAGGDSGSAVVDSNGNPVGLLFAGSSSRTLANPMGDVITALEGELGGADLNFGFPTP